MPDRRVRPVIEREPERPSPEPGRHILPIGEMLMFLGLELSQEPKPAKRIMNLAPDHARNPVLEFSGIRRAIEYFPQGAAGHTLGGLDIQHTKENAPAPKQRLRNSGGCRVVDLKQVERRWGGTKGR